MQQTIKFDGSEYLGRTAAVPWQRSYDDLSCRHCGSSLVGRRESVKQTTVQGVTKVIETFRCRWPGTPGRRITREVATRTS